MSLTIVSLGDHCSIKTGKLDANAADIDGRYPFFTCSVSPLRINTFAFDCEAILVAGNGDLNVKHFAGKFNAYQRTYVISDFSKHIFPRYCYYFLDSYIDTLRQQSIGGVIKYIKLGMLTDALIPLPPLDEQRRIAAILDKADAIRRKRQEALKRVDDLVKSQFIEMFGDPVTNPMGWERGTIRDIAEDVRYGTSKPASELGKYTYLRMNNITYSGELDLSDLKSIDMPDDEVEKYIVRNGDVLFNRTNSKELVGKTCVFNSDTPMVIAGYIIRVRVNNRATPTYLSAFLNSDYGKLILRGICKSIIGQANINAQELQDIKILIPPLPLQTQFAAFVEQADKSKFAMQRQLQEADAFMSALMQQYFAMPDGKEAICA